MSTSLTGLWSQFVSNAQSQHEGLATHYLSGTKLGHALGIPWSHDPFLAFWSRKSGAETFLYDLPAYPLEPAASIVVGLLGFIVATTAYAYASYHLLVPQVQGNSTKAAESRSLRIAIAIPLMVALFFWPAFTGRSGVMILDFWRPALGFRSALLAWDIFTLREIDEVYSWSPTRFFAHLWAFPVEEAELAEREAAEGCKRNARLESLKVYPAVFLQWAIVFLALLYFVPTVDAIKTMPWWSYHLYSYLLGFDVLFVLAFFGDGMLNLIGFLINVEMAPMFESPTNATSIQRFWSTWNKAITVILHRVIFAGAAGAPKKYSSKTTRSALTTDTEPDSGAVTEGGQIDKNGKSKKKLNGLKMTPSTTTTTTTTTTMEPTKEKSQSKPFWKKAAAAQAAFIVSGIFHEHITYFTFGTATMENFAFFTVNGMAAVVAAWFKRTYPQINAQIPTWLAFIILHAFLVVVAPLFCAPFFRAHFFNQLAAFRYELIPARPAPRGSFVRVFG